MLTLKQRRYRKLQRVLEKTFVTFGGRKRDAWKFAFHMSDWDQDLYKLHRVYKNPAGRFKESRGVIYGFLIHATWHLMEAYRLLEGRPCPNPFWPETKLKKGKTKRKATVRRASA